MLTSRRLVDDDRGRALKLAEIEETSALFFIGCTERFGLERYATFGVFEDERLLGLAMHVDNLPPFGKQVLLPVGTGFERLLPSVAEVITEGPDMMMGPRGATEEAARAWPTKWRRYKARRDELLFIQLTPQPLQDLPNLRVRLGAESDVPMLIDFRLRMETESGVALFSSPEQARISALTLIKEGTLFVVEVNSAIVGCSSITTGSSRYEQLGFIYVLPEHRLRGISDYLLISVCNLIHDRGKRPIFFTAPSSEALIHRARIIGFRETGTHHKYYYE